MTTELILVTQQTTNLLVDSVNAKQSEGYLPACGLLNFNARYTQLMARDLTNPKVASCPYFIIDGTDGSDFAEKANRVLAQIPNAACLGNVLYAASRYIQAWGDDAFHSGGGGHSGSVSWADVTDKPAFIAAAGSAEAARAIIDAASTAVATSTANGLMSAADKARLDGMVSGLPWYSQNVWVGGQPFPQIVASAASPYINVVSPGRTQMVLSAEYDGNEMGDLDLMFSVGKDDWWMRSDSYVLGHDIDSTYLQAGDLTDPSHGVRLTMEHPTSGDASVYLEIDNVAVFDSIATTTYLRTKDNVNSVELDATAFRIKRGGNQMFSISDGSGAMTWNGVIRCVWNADGWNVSRDNGVAFTSRATYAAMIGPNGSRAEANNTGLSLSGSDSPTLSSNITLTNGNITAKTANNAEPFLVADNNNTVLRYVGNELTLSNSGTGGDGNATLSSAGADVTLNALTGNVNLNALGQSMSIGPAGLRYTVDGVDVIQSGDTTSRSFPDLTIRRPGGGDMMLDMTADSATLQSGDDSKLQLSTNGDALLSGKDGDVYVDGNGVKVTSASGNQLWCTNGQYIQGDTSYGYMLRVNGVAALDIEVGGTALSHPDRTSLAAGSGTIVHLDNSIHFITGGATPVERLSITDAGQITAPASYTPSADGDLVTVGYMRQNGTGLTTVGTYNASVSGATIVPGKSLYYSSVASAENGVTMYAPTAGPTDVTVAAPSHVAIVISAPSGVSFRRGATTANLITIPPSTNCRFVALSGTEWLVCPSGGAS